MMISTKSKTPLERRDLKGLTHEELADFVCGLGEPPYRAAQIFAWLYDKNVDCVDAMTNLSKTLRDRLRQSARVSRLKLVTKQESAKDGSVKYLFELEDGQAIESVLMFEDKRKTLCVSTQVGCAIDCKFCATGMMGFKRNLTVAEIVEQLLRVQHLTGHKITNMVFMGMGEPFQNYRNVMTACKILCHETGQNMAQKQIVVSTSGILPKIYQFADEGHKYRLAISLNATTDRLRNSLMPLNRRWPLAKLMQAAKYYTSRSKERVTFEYVLLQGKNDSTADARRLKKLTSGIACKINLIPYNTTVGTFQRTSKEQILFFYEALSDLDVPVMIRWSKGDDIAAGCGQLAVTERQVEATSLP